MERKVNIGKVKNVFIIILSIVIMLLMAYLIFIGTVYLTVRAVILYMYDFSYSLDNDSEVLVYTSNIIDEQGKKIKVPVINLRHGDVDTINEEIKQKILEIGNDCDFNYLYSVENDLLTVLIRIETELLLYRIDIGTGKNVVDNIEVLEKYYGIKIYKEKYEEQLRSNSETTEIDDINNPILISLRFSKDIYTLIRDVNNVDKYVDLIQIDLIDIVEGGI